MDDDIIVEYCDIKPVNPAGFKSGHYSFFILMEFFSEQDLPIVLPQIFDVCETSYLRKC